MGRLRLKLAVVLAVCFQFPARSASGQTAAELIAEVEKQSGVAGRENTVDTFKAGDPSTRVRGIAVTMMATLDVLQRAAAQGLNLVITHEPTFYSHRDLTDGLRTEGDSIFAVKAKFIADHGLVVWRFHDRPHAMPPDMIRTGMLRALGWENRRSAASPLVVELEPASVESIARHVKSRLGAGAVRMIGDTSAVAKRVGFTQGFPGFAANKSAVQQSIDVLVMGEDHEWETIAYAADAITAGKLKAVIVLGHVPSEQAGMEEVTRWLKTFVTSVPVRFLPTRDPFVPLR